MALLHDGREEYADGNTRGKGGFLKILGDGEGDTYPPLLITSVRTDPHTYEDRGPTNPPTRRSSHL